MSTSPYSRDFDFEDNEAIGMIAADPYGDAGVAFCAGMSLLLHALTNADPAQRAQWLEKIDHGHIRKSVNTILALRGKRAN